MDYAAILSRVDLQEVRRITRESLSMHVSPGTLIAFEYGLAIGADEPDDVDPRLAGNLKPDFEAFVHGRAEQLIHEEISTLMDKIDEDGTVTVFRAMTVSRSWLEEEHDPTQLGVCWSWDEACAISHNGEHHESGVEVRMRGRVHVDDVDWTLSVAVGAGDDYSTGTENEIRLHAGRPVQLDRVEWRKNFDESYVEWAPAPEMAPV